MKKKSTNFINYITKELNETQLNYLNSINQINQEKSELYGDFIISLNYIINETYLGDDILDEENKKKHFDWCWNKNIKNFENEHIFFIKKGGCYNYFYNYFLEIFYDNDEKNILKSYMKQELFLYNAIVEKLNPIISRSPNTFMYLTNDLIHCIGIFVLNGYNINNITKENIPSKLKSLRITTFKMYFCTS